MAINSAQLTAKLNLDALIAQYDSEGYVFLPPSPETIKICAEFLSNITHLQQPIVTASDFYTICFSWPAQHLYVYCHKPNKWTFHIAHPNHIPLLFDNYKAVIKQLKNLTCKY